MTKWEVSSVRKIIMIVATACGVSSVATADIIQVMTPEAGGNASGYTVVWANGFNQQTDPSTGYTQIDTDATVNLAEDMGYGMVQQYASERIAWIDFGADYSSKVIAGLWLGFNGGNSGTDGLTGDYLVDTWWDSNSDGTKDGTTDADLLAAFNDTYVPQYTSATWQQMYSGNIVPAERYLLVTLQDTDVGRGPASEAREWIFEPGAAIPEADTAMLTLVGALVMLLRRKLRH